MPIARVQSAISSGTSGTATTTFAAPTTAGNLIVFALTVIGSPSINAGSFTIAASQTVAYNPTYVGYLAQASSRSSVSVVLSASLSYPYLLWIGEYSITGATPLDQTGTGTSLTSSPATSPTLTTTSAAELIVFAFGGDDPTSTWSGATNSFLLANQATHASGASLAVFDRIVSSTGSYSTAVTDSAGGHTNMAGSSFAGTSNSVIPRPIVFTVPASSIPQLQF